MANVDSGTHSLAAKQREAAAQAAKATRAAASAPPVPPAPNPAAPISPPPAPAPAVVAVSASRAPAAALQGGIVPDDALNPSQRNAITLLARGRSIKATAQRIGVHRDTVHRWLREDHAFRAAYYTRKAEL